MRYTLEIQKILFQIEDNKSFTPKDKVRLLKQAVNLADENEDIEWAYDLRMMLLSECYHLSSDTELINNFSWILNTYEEHPDLFDESDFLWEYKWVLGMIYDNPDVSLEQAESILEDFKTRLTRNGYSMRPYYDRLYKEALALDQYDKAKEYLDLRNEAPEDAMGNCPACTLDDELDYYMQTGNFEEAYNRAQPILSKQLTCGQVPARTLCTLTYHAWKSGKEELAAELFKQADTEMELLENDENLISEGGMMVSYLADKNTARACHYLEKCLPWMLEADGYSQYDFSALLVEAFRRWNGASAVQLDLPTEFELYSPSGEYAVEALRDHFYQTAHRLARKFDERNGCHTYVERVESLQSI